MAVIRVGMESGRIVRQIRWDINNFISQGHMEMIRINLFMILVSFILAGVISGCATTPLTKPGFSQRKAYVQENNNIGDEIKNAILNGKVIMGMQKSDVIASWGKPTKIYEQTANEREMWYYKGLGSLFEPGKRVFFVNDVVQEVYVSQN